MTGFMDICCVFGKWEQHLIFIPNKRWIKMLLNQMSTFNMKSLRKSSSDPKTQFSIRRFVFSFPLFRVMFGLNTYIMLSPWCDLLSEAIITFTSICCVWSETIYSGMYGHQASVMDNCIGHNILYPVTS